MKKIALLSLTALLAACGGERVEKATEATSFSGDDNITFNIVSGEQTTGATRAKEFSYWATGQTLKVTSYFTNSTDKFRDFELTYNGPYTTSWTYSPVEQSNGQSISYYSWYPESTGVSNPQFSGHTGTMSYIATGTEDLMAANAWGSNPRVSMQFRHLLSEINFAVQCVEGFHVTISQIKLNGIAGQGVYTFNAENGGSWGAATTLLDYPYTPYSATLFPTDGKTSDILYLGNKGGANTADNQNSNALMLLPQSFPGVATGATLTLHYQLVDANGNPYKEGDATAYLSDFTTKKWEMGKRYLYLIDPSGLIENGPITFEILAMGWSDNDIQAEPIIVSEVLNGSMGKLLLEKSITQHNANKGGNSRLTVFPISARINSNLGAGPEDAIVLKDFDGRNFVSGDQIRIFCNNDAWFKRVSLDPSLQGSTWNLQYGLNYITITKL